MAESSQTTKFSGSRLLNPWILHLQKLGLELKCPLCLDLFKRPMLFPCDHILCSSCIPRATQFESQCPVCNVIHADREIRTVPYMENMVAIYRCMDATFCALQSLPYDAGRVLEQCSLSASKGLNDITSKNFEIARKDDLSSRQSTLPFTANKPVDVHFNHSSNDGVNINEKFKSCMPRGDGSMEVEMFGMPGVVHKGEVNHNMTSPNLMLKDGGLERCGNEGIEMNMVGQSSPGSPPGDSDTKGSNNDSNNQNEEIYVAKKGIKVKSASGAEGYGRELKKQKKLHYGPSERGIEINKNIQLAISHPENFAVLNSVSEIQSRRPSSAQESTVSEDLTANNSICAFCQSSRLSEAVGPMMHINNGIQVFGDETHKSNVIHVHTKCFEWAPQVYYAGETIKNLEKEVARSAKLKCSRCGLKGAALGCYAKTCRRSYHVPCAVEDSDCRWDCDDFLLLCPSHSSLRFPNEKSKSRNRVLKNGPVGTQRTSQQSTFWVGLPKGPEEWVLCGSALSSEEKLLLVKFGSMIGVIVSKFWKPNVTHVIASTNASGACTRTLKVLLAILHGRWVLTIDWIKSCMKAMHPVDEEPYEISLDNYGCLNGPQTGRLRVLNNEQKLFNALKFYFAGDFLLAYKEDLQHLVKAGGGITLESLEILEPQNSNDDNSSILIVYNLDPPQGCKLGEVSIIWQRLNEAQDLAAKFQSQVVGHTWILESIAACKLQPVVS